MLAANHIAELCYTVEGFRMDKLRRGNQLLLQFAGDVNP